MAKNAHSDDSAAPLENSIEWLDLQRSVDRTKPVSEPVSDGSVPEEAATVRSPQAGRESAEAASPSIPTPEKNKHKPSIDPLQDPPDLVKKRYLRAGNKYFMKDEQNRLAFEDRGARMVTEHNRPDIAESMAEMALTKGWMAIRVTGHEDFRREVWLSASLRGLEVTGYAPRDVDKARLEALRDERMANRIEAMVPRELTRSADGAQEPSEPPARQAEPNGLPPRQTKTARQLAGELLAHGAAPYRNNAKNSASYYVTYRDAAGPHTIWGIDLGRAISAADARVGDPIALEKRGKRWVTIEVPIRNDAGEVTGIESKEVYRNTWEVQVQRREQGREYEDVGTPIQARSHPTRYAQSLGAAPSTDSNLAGRGISEQLDPIERAREQFFDKSPVFRPSRPATPEDQMKQVHVAVIGEVMRQQGFGERAVERVQAHCARVAGEFQKQGIPVPAPRHYDPKAAPTRRHRAVPASEPHTKEIERGLDPATSPLPSL